MSGSIKLYIGCMRASKSTIMLRDIERAALAGQKCVVIKHASDTRYDHLSKSGGIVCHSGIEYKPKIISSETLSDLSIDEFDTIGISEAQFYNDILFIDNWANAGKTVIVEGLDGTHERLPFGELCNLIPLCEKVIKLSAICQQCPKKASFTKKISGDTDIVIDIGGNDKYLSLCRNCYNNYKK